MSNRQQSWVVTLGVAAVLSAGTWFVVQRVNAQSPRPQPASTVTTITVLELQPLHAAGTALVIDVRDAESFAAGHIAGAVSVPLMSLPDRVDDLRVRAAGRPIVAYCACPTEASSLHAVELLGQRGIAARALVGGYRAWIAAGGR